MIKSIIHCLFSRYMLKYLGTEAARLPDTTQPPASAWRPHLALLPIQYYKGIEKSVFMYLFIYVWIGISKHLHKYGATNPDHLFLKAGCEEMKLCVHPDMQ